MAESTVTADSKLTSSDTRRRIWAIVGASSGNLVEWFDFYVYSFCSLYFAHIFFPSGNTTTQLLQTAGVFAAGFLMRPIGGWLFGRIADKHGRKKSMLLSVCMMCFGSLVIACLPGYETIGTWAPALLLLARLFQGLSVGGEYGTSATYMSEVAVEGRKGFYASFQYVTLIGGQLLALLVVVVLQHTMEDAALREWGWRIPFALGAVLAVVALWLRRQLDETSQQETRALKEAGSLKGLWRNRRAFIMVLGFTAAGSLCFYTFTTYMQKYLVNTAGMHANVASGIMTAALFVFMLIQPLIGALSDKIGLDLNALFWRTRHRLHCPDSQCITEREFTVCGICFSDMRPVDSKLLYLNQRHSEGRKCFRLRLVTSQYDSLMRWPMRYLAARQSIWRSALKSAGIQHAFYWYVTVVGAIAFLVSLTLHRKGKGLRL
ncbi:MFS family transporter [Escherichia coli]